MSRSSHSSQHSLTTRGFASAKCYLDASPRLREEMESQLRIPPALFDRMYFQSNGFAGHSLWLGDNDEVKCYSK